MPLRSAFQQHLNPLNTCFLSYIEIVTNGGIITNCNPIVASYCCDFLNAKDITVTEPGFQNNNLCIRIFSNFLEMNKKETHSK